MYINQKGKIREIRRLATIVVRKQIDLSLLPLRVVSKKKEPIWKGKLVSENTDEIGTQSGLEQMGLLNPVSLKISTYNTNMSIITSLGIRSKVSKAKKRRIGVIYLREWNKNHRGIKDNLNCKERRLIKLNYKFAKSFKKSA